MSKPRKKATRGAEAPSEPLRMTIEPAMGPNTDGLTHLAMLAQAGSDERRAELAQELEARPDAAKE